MNSSLEPEFLTQLACPIPQIFPSVAPKTIDIGTSYYRTAPRRQVLAIYSAMQLSKAVSLQLSPLDSIKCPSTDPNFDTECNNYTDPSTVLFEQLARTKLGDPTAPALLRKLVGVVLCEKHNSPEERDRVLALWMRRLNEKLVVSHFERGRTLMRMPPAAATQGKTAAQQDQQDMREQDRHDERDRK